MDDFIGGDRAGAHGALQKKKFKPGKNFKARASSTLAFAFHFIFDELPTPSRSKMAAIPAKSTKIEVLPGESKFFFKNKIEEIARHRQGLAMTGKDYLLVDAEVRAKLLREGKLSDLDPSAWGIEIHVTVNV